MKNSCQVEISQIKRYNIVDHCCAICGKSSNETTLSYCQNCQFVRYCSRNCQTVDWKLHHKKHCKNLKKLRKAITENKINYEPITGDAKSYFQFISQQLKYYKYLILDSQQYSLEEQQAIIYQRICHQCFKGGWEFKLGTCSKCGFATFCDKHKELVMHEHQHVCDQYSMVLKCHRALNQKYNVMQHEFGVEEDELKKYLLNGRELEFPQKGWHDWKILLQKYQNDTYIKNNISTVKETENFIDSLVTCKEASIQTTQYKSNKNDNIYICDNIQGQNMDINNIDNNVCDVPTQHDSSTNVNIINFSTIQNSNNIIVQNSNNTISDDNNISNNNEIDSHNKIINNNYDWDEINFAIISHRLSWPWTALYCLWKIGKYEQIIQQKDNSEKICLYLVGSDYEEIEALQYFQLVFYFLPQLKEIELFLVGPNLSHEHQQKIQANLDYFSKKRELIVNIKPGLFDSFEIQQWQKPDLIVCYNSGIHEDSNPWFSTIHKFVEMDVPVFTTAYNEDEIYGDSEIIENFCKGRRIMAPQKNPFQSALPLIDVDVKYNCYYINYYIYAFQGKISDV